MYDLRCVAYSRDANRQPNVNFHSLDNFAIKSARKKMTSDEADFAKKDIISAFHAEEDEDDFLIAKESSPEPVFELTPEEKYVSRGLVV